MYKQSAALWPHVSHSKYLFAVMMRQSQVTIQLVLLSRSSLIHSAIISFSVFRWVAVFP